MARGATHTPVSSSPSSPASTSIVAGLQGDDGGTTCESPTGAGESRVEHSVDKACPEAFYTISARCAVGTARARRPKRQKAGGLRALDLPYASPLRIRGGL